MRRVLDLLRERTDGIARGLTLENGKYVAEARVEIERPGNFFEWSMAQSLRAFGTIVPGEPGMQKFVLRRPVGPVLAITPWNVPMSSAARKISSALAAGCSVILKAAEETPGTACSGHGAGLRPDLRFGIPLHRSPERAAPPAWTPTSCRRQSSKALP